MYKIVYGLNKMFNWLKRIFSSCNHKWDILEQRNLYYLSKEDNKNYCYGTKYTLHCKNCGDIKFKTSKY